MRSKLYKIKNRVKRLIIGIILLIAFGVLTYANWLTNQLAIKEANEVTLWAEAIAKKAEMLRHTNHFIEQLAHQERHSVNRWTQATNLVTQIEDPKALSFISQIIADNTNIPVILTTAENRIIDYRNVTYAGIRDSTHLQGDLFAYFNKYPPILVEFFNSKNLIYYTDSKLFQQLKVVLNKSVNQFISEVSDNTADVPVVLTDEQGQLIAYGNIPDRITQDREALNDYIEEIQLKEPIEVYLADGIQHKIYYQNSSIVNQLKMLPYIFSLITFLFMFSLYYLYKWFVREEQNNLWVGLAKETAHQLGTPISSLVAWTSLLKDKIPSTEITSISYVQEIEKDIDHLEQVADRFAKIGSTPKLKTLSVANTLNDAINYIKRRAFEKVEINLAPVDPTLTFQVNEILFKWVIENILKNALDAMDGNGHIHVTVTLQRQQLIILISDTGKGMPKNKFKTIFEPGFSTKARGWGLGLSLSKRIIEVYHSGKVYVKQSVKGQGSVFCIELPC